MPDDKIEAEKISAEIAEFTGLDSSHPLNLRLLDYAMTKSGTEETAALYRLLTYAIEGKTTADSMAKIVELHATPGAMELFIQQRPELAQYVAQCFAEMVRKSPNYTECTFKPKTECLYEFITVTVQKVKGKTPHQLRDEAEKQLALARFHLNQMIVAKPPFLVSLADQPICVFMENGEVLVDFKQFEKHYRTPFSRFGEFCVSTLSLTAPEQPVFTTQAEGV